MTNYKRFSCPNPKCDLFNQTAQGNISHRSWTGKDKQIERLKCTNCSKEFSSNKGSLRENAKITEEKQIIMLKCLRWGVPETGIADIADVSRKTVRLFQQKTAKRAEAHHDQQVANVKEEVVQCDEMYGKSQGGSNWIGIAMGATTLLILGLCVGDRNQRMADFLAASIWSKCKTVPTILTDGWSCYYNAFLRCFGNLCQPAKTGKRGRPRGETLEFPSSFLYAQVVKRAKKIGKRWRLYSVVLKGLSGSISKCKEHIQLSCAGLTINTSFVERFNGSLRNSIGALRRKSRCSVKLKAGLKQKVWVFVSLYNWVIPHSSLSKGNIRVTPAMAAGLATQPMSYSEYIKIPIHSVSNKNRTEDIKIIQMNSQSVLKAAKRHKRKVEEEEEVRWQGEDFEVEIAC